MASKAKKLPSGNWRVQVYDYTDGDRKRKYKSFTAATKKEAEYMAAEFALNKKNKRNPMNITVGEAITLYIESKSNVLSPSTTSGYKKIQRNNLLELQEVKISKLNNEVIQREINRESEKLSPKSISNAYGLLSATLKFVDPALVFSITLPARKKEIKQLLPPKTIMQIIKGKEIEVPVLLAMWLGLRMSEVLGIRKKDIVDGYLTIQQTILLVDNKITVREQTKTYESTRKIRLPKHIIDLIDLKNLKSNDRIINLSGQAVYKRFTRLLESKGLPHMRFHDLRHLNASVMVQLGIPDKYAMERGGWSTNKTLQNVYQHTFSEQRENIDTLIDDYFYSQMQHEIQHEK